MNIITKVTLATAAVAAAGTVSLASPASADSVTYGPEEVAFAANYIYDNPDQFPFGECQKENAWVDSNGVAQDFYCTWHAALHGQTADHNNVHFGGDTWYLDGREVDIQE